MEKQTINRQEKVEPSINLTLDSYYISGARQMLLRLLDNFNIGAMEKCDKNDAVYVKAELDMILSSTDNTRQFLYGDQDIHFRNHESDKRGRLVSVEAYFANSAL